MNLISENCLGELMLLLQKKNMNKIVTITAAKAAATTTEMDGVMIRAWEGERGK